MNQLPRPLRAPATRPAQNDPVHRLVDDAYRLFHRPPPRHAPGCGCALCSDRDSARALSGRAARDWTDAEVLDWSARALRPDPARAGVQLASRTDRGVFRFLLPRVLEMLATGAMPNDAATARMLCQFTPAHMADSMSEGGALLRRFASLVLDRALQDGDLPRDMVATLHVLSCAGWPVAALLRQAQADPDLPAALARAWGRGRLSDGLFSGHWRAGAAELARAGLVSRRMSEALMNYAMAEGTSAEETDAAMRAADAILRNL